MYQHEPKRTAYLRDELRNILTALYITMQSTVEDAGEEVDDAYQRGFTDALRSISLALGLSSDFTVSLISRHQHPRWWKINEQSQIEDGS
jgi:hypothetical protein